MASKAIGLSVVPGTEGVTASEKEIFGGCGCASPSAYRQEGGSVQLRFKDGRKVTISPSEWVMFTSGKSGAVTHEDSVVHLHFSGDETMDMSPREYSALQEMIAETRSKGTL